MPMTETYAMRMYGAKHIPSELLEPIFACLMACWFDQYDRAKSMTKDEFRHRVRALSAVASEAGATHCVIATENMLRRFDDYVGEPV